MLKIDCSRSREKTGTQWTRPTIKKRSVERKTMERKFLEDLGLEKEAVDKVLDANSADIGRQIKLTEAIQARLDNSEVQLKEANKTINGFKDLDVEGIKKAAEDYKTAAEQTKKDADERIASMEYDTLLKESIAHIKFSSEAAKREIVRQLKDKNLKRDKDKILGLDDAIKAMQEADEGAFAPEGNGSWQLPNGARLHQPDSAGHYVKNPFKRGPDFNLTEAGRIAEENPDLAKKLAKEAGMQLE